MDISTLTTDAVYWVQYLELSGVAVAGSLGGNSGDLIVVHVHNLRVLWHGAGVGEGHGHVIVIYPGFAPDGEHLLLILLAVNGHGVGNGGLRRGGHAGGEHIVIGSAPLVNILGGGQDAVANVQLGAGESRGHLQVGDVPVWQ